MLPRARIQAAIQYQPVDTVPLRIFPAPGGLFEHGEKLVELIRRCGHDFGPLDSLAVPPPPPATDFDPDGRYHAISTDAWGTTWEFRIFGIWGHPLRRPLDDWANLPAYRAPALPPPPTDAELAAAATHRQRFYQCGWGGSLFETLRAVRRFEDVLMDLAMDAPEINRLGDLITDHMRGLTARALAMGCDAVSFGDDFGTQTALMISPAVFRRFFKPRYAAVFEPVRKAGRQIFFHSCGHIGPILDDLRDLGVDVIWPQLPAFDLPELAARCRRLGLALELHPDRGDLMQRASADQPGRIRDYIHRLADLFNPQAGGSWLYLEVDPGFPWANVEAMFETAMELRGNRD